MIPLKSLGYRTELLVNGFENRIEDRGDYVFIQTPTNPGFFWGNLLLFRRPPSEVDVESWPAIFAKEFAHEPKIKHCTLAWDSPTAEMGEAQKFLDRGYTREHSVVLTATEIHAPVNANDRAEIRPLATDEDWSRATELQATDRPAHLAKEPFEIFKRNLFARYRRMSEAGLGHWYGAFIDGEQVANCGIYVAKVAKVGLARYQSVITDANHRRKGVAGRLVYEAGLHALANGANKLVMVADEGAPPARIYQSCGFAPTEKMIGVYKFPPMDQQ